MTWQVQREDFGAGYDRRRSPRAWSNGNLVLVPPEVWSNNKLSRQRIRALMRMPQSPEIAGGMMEVIAAVSEKLDANRASEASSDRPLLSRAQVQDFYKRMHERAVERARARTDESIDPPSEGGRYTSSVHSPGANSGAGEPHTALSPPLRAGQHAPGDPKLLTDQELQEIGPSGRPRWAEREIERRRKARDEDRERTNQEKRRLNEALESLLNKIRGGKKDG